VKAYFVLAADAALLVALFYVVEDWTWRVAYAESPHGHTEGYAVSFSYSLFTQIFTMSANGARLASPPTLDWTQVLVAALVVVNAWYLYSRFSKREGVSVPADPVPS
jgi:hypothetical protein